MEDSQPARKDDASETPIADAAPVGDSRPDPPPVAEPAQLSLWPSEDAVQQAPETFPGTFDAAPRPKPMPADPPWSTGDIVSFIVFAFVSFLGANIAGVAIFSLLRARFGWHVTIEQAFSQAYWVVGMQTGWELLWLVFIYHIVCLKYRRGFWEGLKWVKFGQPPWVFLLAGAAVAFVAQAVMNLFPSQKHLPIEKLFTSQSAGYLLAIFGIFIAPFIEELVFRGFFYPVFEKLWGLWIAVVLSALMFAAIHAPQLGGSWAEIASIFVVGAIFSYCRGKTGSLVPSYLMHLAYNSSLFVSLYVTTDQFRNLKG